jgi:hypothetical protein
LHQKRVTVNLPDQLHRFVVRQLGLHGETMNEYFRRLIKETPEYKRAVTTVGRTLTYDQPLFDIYGKPRDPAREYTHDGHPLGTADEQAEIDEAYQRDKANGLIP